MSPIKVSASSLFALCLSCSGGAAAEMIAVDHNLLAGGATWLADPRLGVDASGTILVYTEHQMLTLPTGDRTAGPGDIVMQRLTGTQPAGAATVISSSLTSNQWPSISGSRIVYTSRDGSNGQVMLYDASSGTTSPLSNFGPVQDSAIDGSTVMWVEGTSGATTAVMWDINWTGTGLSPIIIAGPTPAAVDVDIGNRYAVWRQRQGSLPGPGPGPTDIVAYSLNTGTRHTVAADPTLWEYNAATSGDWVVYEAQNFIADPGKTSIFAKNMATGEARTIADNGASNYRPAIDGDFVVFESNMNGNFDIYGYQLSTAELFRITDDPENQTYADISGNMVVWMDSYWNRDIWGARLVSAAQPVSNVPEPETYAMLLAGLGLLGFTARRRKNLAA